MIDIRNRTHCDLKNVRGPLLSDKNVMDTVMDNEISYCKDFETGKDNANEEQEIWKVIKSCTSGNKKLMLKLCKITKEEFLLQKLKRI